MLKVNGWRSYFVVEFARTDKDFCSEGAPQSSSIGRETVSTAQNAVARTRIFFALMTPGSRYTAATAGSTGRALILIAD
jgi:hypothetical protein